MERRLVGVLADEEILRRGLLGDVGGLFGGAGRQQQKGCQKGYRNGSLAHVLSQFYYHKDSDFL